MKRIVIAALILTCIAGHAAAQPYPRQEPLFNGKNLEGWTQKGGKANYKVAKDEDDNPIILGTTVPRTPNSFLCTVKRYGDFILEYEYKCDDRLNSGVQIRSNAFDKPMDFVVGAKKRTVAEGRVHGYQIEIDANKPQRMWSGGVYEEGRRGWLFPGAGGGDTAKVSEQGKEAYKPGKWNHVRVVAKGPRIQTWLNGVPRADLVDPFTVDGFIGLQVHGVGKVEEPLPVAWRNIKIIDLGRLKWQPIFDGKTLNGWTPTVENTWSVKDGAIVGRCAASEKRHSILISDKQYDNFTLRVVYKAIEGNSGVYFRVDKVAGSVGVHGFQAEIDPNNDAGGLYETGGRGWVVKPTAEQVKSWYRPNEWNEMVVSAHGKRVVVHVNGVKTAELINDQGRTKGHLGLQLHGGQDMHVRFKRVELLQRAD